MDDLDMLIVEVQARSDNSKGVYLNEFKGEKGDYYDLVWQFSETRIDVE